MTTVNKPLEVHQLAELTGQQPTAYATQNEYVSCGLYTDQQTVLLRLVRCVLLGSYGMCLDLHRFKVTLCSDSTTCAIQLTWPPAM